MRVRSRCVVLTFVLGMLLVPARGADWPAWRADARHSGLAGASLADNLQLQWRRALGTPASAWPASQAKLQFDASYEPVLAGRRIFVPSMVRDRVTAYDTRTGKELWRFYAEGPVRFAPVAWEGKLYVAAEDGWLYCLAQDTGRLQWKFRGAPTDQKVLGNDRLVSAWPLRGAPVIVDGTVYFAAGIWPFMGTFLYAVDAATGKEIWCNSGSGAIWMPQPHGGAVAFAAVAPQGYLTADRGKLIVPCGRATPAVFDGKTGALEFFKFDKRAGGYDTAAAGGMYFNRGGIFSLAKGEHQGEFPVAVVTDEAMTGVVRGELVRQGTTSAMRTVTVKDKRGKAKKVRQRGYEPLGQVAVPFTRAYLQAGERVFGAKPGLVAAVAVPKAADRQARVTWQAPVPGTVWNMLAGDDRLFVVTVEGELLCFGPGKAEPAVLQETSPAAAGARASGYAVFVNPPPPRDAIDQIKQLDGMYVVFAEASADRAAKLRRALDDIGLYGPRAAVVTAAPADLHLPAYMAISLVVRRVDAGKLAADGAALGRLLAAIHPYGGGGVFECESGDPAVLATAAKATKTPGVTVEVKGKSVYARRPGPLPGTADWTHQYADAGNSAISQDDTVRAPLGLLWFGGPPNDKILPRHGHGPSPQVIGGRLFIEGPDVLRAVDVYTGAMLWEASLPGVGTYYDNTSHQPGAGGIGSNYVSLADGIYVAYGTTCVVLDPATGRKLRELTLPKVGGVQPNWGYLGAAGNVLLAGSAPLAAVPKLAKTKLLGVDVRENARYAVASRHLVALDRHTGKVLWQRQARRNFRHNAIALGAGKVFCIDKLTRQRLGWLQRRGQETDDAGQLLALDLTTGKVVWQTGEGVFGTWLSYSAEHGLLLQAGSKNRDRQSDEVGQGMAVYRAADGKVVWHDAKISYGGPPLLWGDRIICQGPAFELLTGKPATRASAVTGAENPWNFTRTYGCNTAIGSKHLLTFRSGAAGYYDLLRDGGTGNFGGFKSGCTSNLIVADGLLNAPDYTRTCTCAYQNLASLALMHMPDVETWTFSSYGYKGKTVKRIGLNFGAPGDRRADDGTLWLDSPSIGGRSPDVPVNFEPAGRETFRHHSLRLAGGPIKWVAGSGMLGATKISVTLASPADSATPRNYTVRLVFAEMDDSVPPGGRVFDVALQGKRVLKAFDISAAAGRRKGIVKEFKGVPVQSKLVIDLTPVKGQTSISGVEIIAE